MEYPSKEIRRYINRIEDMKDRAHKTLLMINMSFAYDWDHSIVNRNFHILQQARNSGQFSKIVSVDFFPFTWKKQVKYLLAIS